MPDDPGEDWEYTPLTPVERALAIAFGAVLFALLAAAAILSIG